jgi:hypothetical protein
MKTLIKALFISFFVLLISPANSHVGSPGVIFEGEAGDYQIIVNVNPPDVIPGTADVQVYSTSEGIEQIFIRPIYWYTGDEGSPRADQAFPVENASGQYQGQVWLMENGAASIEVKVIGTNGEGTALVPVMAVSTAQKEMDASLGWMLGGLGIFLVILMITIIGNSVSDATQPPGEIRSNQRRKKLIGMAVSAVVLALILYGGMSWWNSWAESYRRYMFKPFQASSSAEQTKYGKKMTFQIDSSYLEYRSRTLSFNYMIPDHGKLMHMFLIREGSLDAFAHLHPVRKDSLTFEVNLPHLPTGQYFVFADIVRGHGWHETIADTLIISEPGINVQLASMQDENSWQPSDPDDTYIISNPVLPEQVLLASSNIVTCGKPGIKTPLPDGSTAIWEHDGEKLQANRLYPMTFSIFNPNGEPAELEPYMGMMGHAVVMKHDGSVYIHLHPVGNYSSATQDLIKRRLKDGNPTFAGFSPADQFRDSVDQVISRIKAMSEEERSNYLMEMMGHEVSYEGVGEHEGHSVVVFPYSFPEPGNYRIWIQMKRNGKVLNTAFDAVVTE